MPTAKVTIATYDGPCSTELVTPDGEGPWPAVILLHDAGGPRTAMVQMAERIATMGYVVAVPDLFHREAPLREAFLDGADVTLGAVLGLMSDAVKGPLFFQRYYGACLEYKNLETTIKAVLDHLTGRGDGRGSIGTTGYCMGGNASVRLATIFGDRIAATASFHPGRLVVQTPDSPHLRVRSIKARVYIAGASEDASLTDADKVTLTEALTAADVEHEVVTYPGKHGFAVPDSTGTYDAACAELHYTALDRLFSTTLA